MVLEESGHVEIPQKKFLRGGIVAGSGRLRVERRVIPGVCPADQVEGEGLQHREFAARHGVEEAVVHIGKTEHYDLPTLDDHVAVEFGFVTARIVIPDADASVLAQLDRLTTELADEFGEPGPAFGFDPAVTGEDFLIVGESGFNDVPLRAGNALGGPDFASVGIAVAKTGSDQPLAGYEFAARPVLGAGPEPQPVADSLVATVTRNPTEPCRRLRASDPARAG
ncbi:MAG: hypothetical protein KJ057_02120 [Phycisphaerae bacterium]|nr:MAG: hypothetical protein F9K17_16290 [Phycisphaerae bacterium]MBE7455988.1 hypothetical protein [Planctomycetia bacterium]MCK6465115.1 hypothetical protein [Phycisphaerae bacterium]MCL4717246.1 hypothetical protein [Phycisphaerae bacterium]